MEFRILGPLEVLRDGAPVDVRGHRQRALLALLLLHANELVSTDRIVDELWGPQPPRTATTSLQNGISALRKLLGDGALVTRAPGYVLKVAPDALDAARFRRLIEQARGAEPVVAATLLREALALWRGPPLADLELDEFVQRDVRHLEELRLAALEDRIDADLAVGRHAEVGVELEALVREHPLRERLREQLMVALYRAGRQADALAVYQNGRRVLAEELGIDPGPSIQRLHGAILRQDRRIDAADAAGRQPEGHFDEVARALLGGRLVVVLGVDTTTLATALAGRVELADAQPPELTRIAQHAALARGTGPLYDAIHELVAHASPGRVHRFLARLPALLRDRGAPYPLLVTTGYDLALEQALLDAGEQFDLVTYLAAGRSRGCFCHVDPAGTPRVIEVPNAYAAELSPERRTVVLRLAGGIDRAPERDRESFVVTEDDFIDYLAERPLAQAVPVGLAARLRRSHLLFLTCGVGEWSLRTLIARVWGADGLRYRSWAVADAAPATDRRAWHLRGVEPVDQPIDDYVETLARHAGLPAEAPA